MQTNKRIGWVDSLRGMAMILVIMGHAHITYPGVIKAEIYSFHMPLFFILSGWVFRVGQDIDFKRFITKKIKKMIIPLLAFNVFQWMFYALYYGILLKQKEILPLYEYFYKILLEGHGSYKWTSAFWFIPCLFIAQMLLYFIVKYMKKNKAGIVYCIMLLLGVMYIQFVNKPLPWCLDTVPVAIFFMGMGNLLSENWDNLKQKINIFVTSALILINIVTMYLNFTYIGKNVDLNSGILGNPILYVASSICGSIALMSIFSNIKSDLPILEYVGKNSIWFYFIHDMMFAIADMVIFNLLHINVGKCYEVVQFLILLVYVTITLLGIWIVLKLVNLTIRKYRRKQ